MMPMTSGHVLINLIAYYFRNWRAFSVGFADVTLPSLRFKNLFPCLIWFSGGLAYYGNHQYFGQISSNVFLTDTLIGIIRVVC